MPKAKETLQGKGDKKQKPISSFFKDKPSTTISASKLFSEIKPSRPTAAQQRSPLTESTSDNSSDSFIIPDTPDVQENKRKFSGRSFLSSSTSLNHGKAVGPLKQRTVHKPAVQFGRVAPPTVRVEIEKCSNEALLHTMGVMPSMNHRKRAPPTASTGVSPNPKRLSHKKTPSKLGLRAQVIGARRSASRNLMDSLEDEMDSLTPPTPPLKWGIKRDAPKVHAKMAPKQTKSEAEDVGYLDSLLCEMKSAQPTVSKKTVPEETPLVVMEPELDDSQGSMNDGLGDIIQELRLKYTPKPKKVGEAKRPKRPTESPSEAAVIVGSKPSPGASVKSNPPIKTPEKDELFSHNDSWMMDVSTMAADFSKFSPFKSQVPRREEPLPIDQYGRHRVTAVSLQSNRLELSLESVSDSSEHTVCLEGSWMETHVSSGCIVHLLDPVNQGGFSRITETQGLIVVNPDLLISGTSVVAGLHCMRRSVLNEKFKGCDPMNIHMLQGSIMHAIFQQILSRKAYTESEMGNICDEILSQNNFLHDMFGQNLTEEKLREEVSLLLPHIRAFVDKHVCKSNRQMGMKGPTDDLLHIEDVADIEENVWSPRYGVKGKIDLTLNVRIRPNNKSVWENKCVPLELKTGKASFSVEHKGQVTLYSMMSGDRRQEPHSGILLYIKHSAMETVSANHINKKGLIQLRNEMAHYIIESRKNAHSALPKPINNERFCSKCPQLLNCSLYMQCVESLTLPDDHLMSKLAPESLTHLTHSQREYFTHWFKLVHLEEIAAERRKKKPSEIWCLPAYEREQKRSCLSGVVLCADRCSSLSYESFVSVFTRKPNHPSAVSLHHTGVTVNDSVVISTENKPYIALCNYATITGIDASSVTVVTDRDMRNYKDFPETIYRLDKVDSYNSAAQTLTCLSSLMTPTLHSYKLRSIVIDRKRPEFDLTMSRRIVEKVKDIFTTLNKPQKTAILKVLMCKDYILIKGYPGTGKTSTIVALVRVLVSLGQSVLLTSYTHSAVDNILLKLNKYNVPYVRLGRPERVHPVIQQRSAASLTKGMRSVEEISQFYASMPVVATTCLGASASNAVLSKRRFDVCIVDEASQVLQPACFGPLLLSEKFVLVGDPLQLPPVVQSQQAKDLGMAESLFARLDDTAATYELNLQYRMNKEIMRLSNHLIYNNALKCGSDKIAESRLKLDPSTLSQCSDWQRKALSPEKGYEVVFLDTASHRPPPDGVTNTFEVSVISSLVEILSKNCFCEDDIGVIAPYRQQVQLLSDALRERALHNVEVNTVDQFQGRDKDVILLSFVRGQEADGPVSEILKDERRLNVAITRPKHKLILVGNKDAMRSYLPCDQLINILTHTQIISIPKDALQPLHLRRD